MSDIIRQSTVDTYLNFLQNYDTSFKIPLISEWAAKNRYIPAGVTEYPGYVDHSIAPQLVEIQDCFSPDCDIYDVTVMKGTQSMVTGMADSIIGHSIRYGLHNVLSVISSKSIAKLRTSSGIDVMIDNSGLAPYIRPISNRTGAKAADGAFYKELYGGKRYMATSYGSVGDLKSASWDLIILDELTEAGAEIANQGDVVDMIIKRATTIRDYKVLAFSTPTNASSCRTYKRFMAGDQRYWYVPCPVCGEFQIMKLKAQGRDWGLTARYDKLKNGKVSLIAESIEYICEHCKTSLMEYQKPLMMADGKWIPHSESQNPRARSYHNPSIYSPIMMYTWEKLLTEFLDTDFGRNTLKFKNFVLTVLGEPWQNKAKKKKWEDLKARKMHYKQGEIPPGGLVITGGIDVQRDRLELQLVAWGHGMESWSFDYKVFYGDPSNHENEVWQTMRQYCYNTFKIYNNEFHISRIAIDTGHNPNERRVRDWGQKAHTVYNFVKYNSEMFIAIKGSGESAPLFKQHRISDAITVRYDVNVSLIKHSITECLDLDDGSQAIHFVDHDDEFFKMFASETYTETSKGKWEWKKDYERNEAWDTWIYARFAAEHLGLSTWNNDTWDLYEEEAKSII